MVDVTVLCVAVAGLLTSMGTCLAAMRLKTVHSLCCDVKMGSAGSSDLGQAQHNTGGAISYVPRTPPSNYPPSSVAATVNQSIAIPRKPDNYVIEDTPRRSNTH